MIIYVLVACAGIAGKPAEPCFVTRPEQRFTKIEDCRAARDRFNGLIDQSKASSLYVCMKKDIPVLEPVE